MKTGKVNYKKLPFVIIFNGCDLFDIKSANEFCKQWEGLMSTIWCNSASQDRLKEAYSEDRFQKLKKEKEKISAENALLKECFSEFLTLQNKKIIEVLNENARRTVALTEDEERRADALIEEERKKNAALMEEERKKNTDLIKKGRKKLAAEIDLERKRTIEALENFFEKQLKEIKRLMN